MVHMFMMLSWPKIVIAEFLFYHMSRFKTYPFVYYRDM